MASEADRLVTSLALSHLAPEDWCPQDTQPLSEVVTSLAGLNGLHGPNGLCTLFFAASLDRHDLRLSRDPKTPATVSARHDGRVVSPRAVCKK